MIISKITDVNAAMLKYKWDNSRPVVAVQGLGFVGAVSAILIANARDSKNQPCFNVIGIDLPNQAGSERVAALSSGNFPISSGDPVLSSMLLTALEQENIIFTTCPESYSHAEIVVVDIPLGIDWNTKKLEWQLFLDGIADFARHIPASALVIIETTVPPGTTEERIWPLIKQIFLERGLPTEDLSVAHAYERVMPGPDYWKSVTELPRVYSGIDAKAKDRCRQFLSKVLPHGGDHLRELDSPRASETAKLMENSYRAVNIAFVEEWSAFAEEIGVDLFEVIKVIRERPTHANLMPPGFGVGGYCLTKDPLFARAAAEDIYANPEHNFPFCSLAVNTNQNMPLRTLDHLVTLLGGSLKGKRLHLLGVSYRSDLADTRWSPSEIFVKAAEAAGAIVDLYDPYVPHWSELDRTVQSDLQIANDCSAIVVAVPHQQIKQLNFSKLEIPQGAFVFDSAGVLSNEQQMELSKRNLRYYSIGRTLSTCFTH